MKKKLLILFFIVTFFALSAPSASAVVNDTVKVGLRYGSSALFSANLENAVGSGYEFGYYEEDRSFTPLGWTEETAISMTAAGNIYMDDSGIYSASVPSGGYRSLGEWHVQIDGFRSYEEAADRARSEGGWPAWVDWEYVVRVGCYGSQGEAEDTAGRYGGRAARSSATGVVVTVTGTDEVLFAFDCSGAKSLGILPDGGREKARTWFKGYRWYGGFEYRRSTGGNLNVINVVDLDDYVKGVLPYEMSPVWPLEALKAQAVCARTYALLPSKHYNSYRFDVCNTIDCQVYQGTNLSSALTDQAVEETAGVVAMYGGKYAETYYCSANGGASEASENVWSNPLPYLVGKEDPYEAMTDIPDYQYTIHYTFRQLGQRLKDKGYSIGTVCAAYVSKTTPTGNVAEITVKDTSGKTVKLTKEACRWTLDAKSMRFTISGGGGGESWFVNPSASPLSALKEAYAISGKGLVGLLGSGSSYAITSSGVSELKGSASSGTGDGITITGTGWGHGVGMSQYGAKAMAEQGYSYEDILYFYYTGITLDRVR